MMKASTKAIHGDEIRIECVGENVFIVESTDAAMGKSVRCVIGRSNLIDLRDSINVILEDIRG